MTICEKVGNTSKHGKNLTKFFFEIIPHVPISSKMQEKDNFRIFPHVPMSSKVQEKVFMKSSIFE